MGRRSVTSTKSGKFMNPTDQARKEARKKELKKNKKQRLLVRTAVLKNKDAGQIIKELDKLDEIEYNPLEPPSLAEKVLKDKRKKLKETLDRVMKLYQKENPSYWSELKRVESDYERRRFHRIQYYEAVKQAESVSNVEDIPLPDMLAPAGGSVSDIPLPDESTGAIPPPSEVQGILKKVPMVSVAPGTPTFQGRDPPGVPVGPPPDLSDMDEFSDDDEEEVEVSVQEAGNKSKGVRFREENKGAGGEDKTLMEMDKFMKEVEEEFKSLAEEDLQPPGTEPDASGSATAAAVAAELDDEPSSRRMHNSMRSQDEMASMSQRELFHKSKPDTAAAAATAIAAAASRTPFPPPQPHYFPPPPNPNMNMANRMRYPPPIPPMMRPTYGARPPAGPYHPSGSGGRYRPQRSNVFSGAPQIVKSDNKIVSDSMIQAKPQIRSLSADVTRFIPTAVKTRKDEPYKPRKAEYQIGQSHSHYKEQVPAKQPLQSKDDAYAEFMKEMSGLM